MSEIELKPASVFECFAKVNQVPRPSKREEKMIEYVNDRRRGERAYYIRQRVLEQRHVALIVKRHFLTILSLALSCLSQSR